jgi:predicted nucleotidyltransferase
VYSKYFDEIPVTVQKYVKAIAESGFAKKIILFGSRARGDFRENSDFDFAVEWEQFRLNDVLKLTSQMDEEALTLYKIDLVDINDVAKEYLEEIKNEGKLIWQKKDF